MKNDQHYKPMGKLIMARLCDQLSRIIDTFDCSQMSDLSMAASMLPPPIYPNATAGTMGRIKVDPIPSIQSRIVPINPMPNPIPNAIPTLNGINGLNPLMYPTVTPIHTVGSIAGPIPSIPSMGSIHQAPNHPNGPTQEPVDAATNQKILNILNELNANNRGTGGSGVSATVNSTNVIPKHSPTIPTVSSFSSLGQISSISADSGPSENYSSSDTDSTIISGGGGSGVMKAINLNGQVAMQPIQCRPDETVMKLISKICGPAASSTLINNSPITTTNTLHNELGTIPIVPVSVPVVTAPSTNTTPVATVQNIRVLGAPQTPSAIVASPISSQPSNMEELLKRLNAKGGDPKKEKKENKEGDQSVRQSVPSGPLDSGSKSPNGGMAPFPSH